MLDCRLNWRRAGRLERAKECRGIKREQKGPPPPISLLPSFSRLFLPSSLLLPLARSSPLVLRPHARTEHETGIFVFILSQLFSPYAPLAPARFFRLFPPSTKARDFSSHTAYPPRPLTRHCRAFEHYSFALSLSRSEGEEDDSESGRKREKREAKIFLECGPRESVSIVRYSCFITFN